MNIHLYDGLPFTTVTLVHGKQTLTLTDVLLDTGSAGTIFPTDKLLTIGITLSPHDNIHRVFGIGGSEFVFSKQIEQIRLGAFTAHNFKVEVGAMDYGFRLDGILGMDFLLAMPAIIDLAQQTITSTIRPE